MTCSACGQALPERAKFCAECGAAVTRRCASARIYAHAPECLEDESGRWWITSCGWPHELCQPVIPSSVGIHELDWRADRA